MSSIKFGFLIYGVAIFIALLIGVAGRYFNLAQNVRNGICLSSGLVLGCTAAITTILRSKK